MARSAIFPARREASLAIAPGHARLRSESPERSWEENSSGPPAAAAADLIDAVQSQPGLRLERKTGPVQELVIDYIDKSPGTTARQFLHAAPAMF